MPRSRYCRRAAALFLTSVAALLFAAPITQAHAAPRSTDTVSAAGATTAPDAPAGKILPLAEPLAADDAAEYAI